MATEMLNKESKVEPISTDRHTDRSNVSIEFKAESQQGTVIGNICKKGEAMI